MIKSSASRLRCIPTIDAQKRKSADEDNKLKKSSKYEQQTYKIPIAYSLHTIASNSGKSQISSQLQSVDIERIPS